jgi:formylglycine-generating enzyme required for sulfatase activity
LARQQENASIASSLWAKEMRLNWMAFVLVIILPAVTVICNRTCRADEPPVVVGSGVSAPISTAKGVIVKPGSVDAVVTNSLGMKLTYIPAGAFLMGTYVPVSKLVTGSNPLYPKEQPQHRAEITHAFYCGVTEVTQEEWKAVMGTEPWKGSKRVREGAKYAASCISWEAAADFCHRLTRRERIADGLGPTDVYRLPTEAEWEYACRGGTTTMYSFGDNWTDLDNYGWYGGLFDDGNAKGEPYPHQVGRKRPNEWGLYDMHGNVFEWCQDAYDKDYYKQSTACDPVNLSEIALRVLRGGAWGSGPEGCRSAYRGSAQRYDRTDEERGFRVVRGLPINDSCSGSK